MKSFNYDPTLDQMRLLLPLVIDRVVNEYPLVPWTCSQCVFEAKTREPYSEIYNDPSEAHYLCPVLNKEVWGEDPECEDFNKAVLNKSLFMMQNYLAEKSDDSSV